MMIILFEEMQIWIRLFKQRVKNIFEKYNFKNVKFHCSRFRKYNFLKSSFFLRNYILMKC